MTLQKWRLIRIFNLGWVYENLKENNKQICLNDVETLLKKTLINPNDDELDDVYNEVQDQLAKTKEIIYKKLTKDKYQKENSFKYTPFSEMYAYSTYASTRSFYTTEIIDSVQKIHKIINEIGK